MEQKCFCSSCNESGTVSISSWCDRSLLLLLFRFRVVRSGTQEKARDQESMSRVSTLPLLHDESRKSLQQKILKQNSKLFIKHCRRYTRMKSPNVIVVWQWNTPFNDIPLPVSLVPRAPRGTVGGGASLQSSMVQQRGGRAVRWGAARRLSRWGVCSCFN